MFRADTVTLRVVAWSVSAMIEVIGTQNYWLDTGVWSDNSFWRCPLLHQPYQLLWICNFFGTDKMSFPNFCFFRGIIWSLSGDAAPLNPLWLHPTSSLTTLEVDVGVEVRMKRRFWYRYCTVLRKSSASNTFCNARLSNDKLLPSKLAGSHSKDFLRL